MADDGENQDTEKESSGGGKKKVILLAVLGVLLIGVSIGGTIAVLSILGGGKPAAESGEVAMEEEVVEEPMLPAIYYPLKPPIMTSFEAKGRQRLIQADITLMTRDNDVITALELHMPMIRNALVLLISGQVYEDIQTAEGKELLRVQSLGELQGLLEKEIGKPGIEEVLFTGLILQ